MNNFEEETMNGTITDSNNTITASEVQTIPNLTDSLNKKQETRKLLGTMLLIVALFLGFVGAWVTFLAPEEKQVGTPSPVMEVSTRGEYVTDTMSYMTDCIAYFDSAEESYICLSIYDTADGFHITPICINANDFDKYTPYLEWAYYADATEPEPLTLLGYSEPVNDSLRQYINEGIADFYGEGLSDELYDEFVSQVYIVVGDVRAQYYSYIMSIVLFTLAVIALIIGCYLLFVKPQTVESDNGMVNDYSYNSLLFGVFGAIIGAAIGGTVWVLVGLAGVIVGYIGFLIYFLSILGFMAFCRDKTKFGIGLSCILSVLTVFAATFMVAVFQVHNQMNDGSIGFVPLSASLRYTVNLLKDFKKSEYLWGNIAIGEIFVVFGFVTRLTNAKKEKKKRS